MVRVFCFEYNSLCSSPNQVKLKTIILIFVNYKKGCTRLAAASDKVYQLLAHGRWFSPGTPAFSTTKTGESGTKHQKSINPMNTVLHFVCVDT